MKKKILLLIIITIVLLALKSKVLAAKTISVCDYRNEIDFSSSTNLQEAFETLENGIGLCDGYLVSYVAYKVFSFLYVFIYSFAIVILFRITTTIAYAVIRKCIFKTRIIKKEKNIRKIMMAINK